MEHREWVNTRAEFDRVYVVTLLPNKFQRSYRNLSRSIKDENSRVEIYPENLSHSSFLSLGRQPGSKVNRVIRVLYDLVGNLRDQTLRIGGFRCYDSYPRSSQIVGLGVEDSYALRHFGMEVQGKLPSNIRTVRIPNETHMSLAKGKFVNMDAVYDRLESVSWVYKATALALIGIRQDNASKRLEVLATVPIPSLREQAREREQRNAVRVKSFSACR